MSLHDEFDSFARAVISPRASAQQVEDLRAAFFAGGISALVLFTRTIRSKEDGPDLNALEALLNECLEFDRRMRTEGAEQRVTKH
jgi:hypothetical protein